MSMNWSPMPDSPTPPPTVWLSPKDLIELEALDRQRDSGDLILTSQFCGKCETFRMNLNVRTGEKYCAGCTRARERREYAEYLDLRKYARRIEDKLGTERERVAQLRALLVVTVVGWALLLMKLVWE